MQLIMDFAQKWHFVEEDEGVMTRRNLRGSQGRRFLRDFLAQKVSNVLYLGGQPLRVKTSLGERTESSQ